MNPAGSSNGNGRIHRMSTLRIGIDLGGTKIAGIVLDSGDATLAETRRPSPREDYAGTIDAIVAVVTTLEQDAAITGASIGIGMPGSLSPRTRRRPECQFDMAQRQAV